MAENSAIEWTDATFNPWMGCTKVSPACDHCYAERDTARFGRVQWGAGQPRIRTSTKNWQEPIRWNSQHAAFAAAHGRRRRVFCASLADVFDNEVDPAWRVALLELIAATPNLDWLLLTKRIGNAHRMLDDALAVLSHGLTCWADAPWPNVWLGATIADQAEADRDIPKLAKVPAAVRFLSMEPLLGQVNIEKWLDPWTCSNCRYHGGESETGPCCCDDCGVEAVYAPEIGSARCPICGKDDGTSDDVGGTCPNCESVWGWSRDYGLKFDSEKRLIDWVIVGGESGPQARPMHPAWARALRDQCAAADVPFLFKQWGNWAPHTATPGGDEGGDLRSGRVRYLTGDDRTPDGHFRRGDAAMANVGKKAAGRLLDGAEHNGYPVGRPL
jgi:protein gp37